MKNILDNHFHKIMCGVLLIFTISIMIYFNNYQPKIYNIPSDFISISKYKGEKGEFLGKNGDILINVYELKKMSSSDYLYISEGNIMDGKAQQYLLMNKNVEEPVLRYNIKRIEIVMTDGEIISIEDKQVINNLTTLRKEQVSEKIEYISGLKENATFYFDLPCKLTWKCDIIKDEFGQVHLICYDIEKGGLYDYNATSILADLL